MRQNTAEANRLSGLATARREFARLVPQGCFLPEWRWPFVQVRARQRRCAVPAAVMRSAKANRHSNSQVAKSWQVKMRAMCLVLFQVKSQVMQQLLVQAMKSVLPLLVPQDCYLPAPLEIPPVQVRGRQYSPGPVPYAFFPGIPGVQKCNRAARCVDYPTSAQYRSRRNRGGLAGCGNKRTHLPHTRVHHAGTCRIAVGDKCLFLPRRIPD